MKKKSLFYIAAASASIFTSSGYSSVILNVDLGRAAGWVPVQSGFTKIGVNTPATTIATSEGDVSVAFSWGATAPSFWSADVLIDNGAFTYSDLYQSYLEANNVMDPINLILSGDGIDASQQYELRVFSMEPNGNPGRNTVFTPSDGTLGDALTVTYTAPTTSEDGNYLTSNFQNSGLLEVTSSASGIITIQMTPDGGLGMNDRIIFSGFQLAVVPEPSTYAAFFGIFAIFSVMLSRKRAMRSHSKLNK